MDTSEIKQALESSPIDASIMGLAVSEGQKPLRDAVAAEM